MSNFTIELGVEAKSKISGFKGMVTSRSEHLNGCNRYWLEPKVNKDGTLMTGSWFDENELIVTTKAKLDKKNPERGGFPSIIK